MPTSAKVPSAIDFAGLENEDRQKAQARYQQGLTSGYDEETAAALYLMPIDAKWKIIKSNPTEFQDQSKLNKINDDFEGATASAVRNLDRNTPAAQAILSRVAPVASSWSSVGVKPALPADKIAELNMLQSEINRLESAKTDYGKQARMNSDEAKRKTATEALYLTSGLLEEAKSKMLQMLGRGEQPAPSAALTAPAAVPRMAIGTQEALFGTPAGSGIQLPQQEPFVAPADRPEPINAAAALSRTPLMFFAGRPDLSTVTREEADAAWAARFPTTKQDVAAADALTRKVAADVAGTKAVAPKKSTAKIPTFDSEETARADGFKAGDIIYLTGIGKVRLK